MMLPNEYQQETAKTEIYTEASARFLTDLSPEEMINFLSLMYCTGKLSGEVGEIDEIVFKAFRGDTGRISDEVRLKLFKELGDVQWYLARIADLLDFTLEDIMVANLKKLQDRQERGVLHGYGDER